jgi:hypothetical protein
MKMQAVKFFIITIPIVFLLNPGYLEAKTLPRYRGTSGTGTSSAVSRPSNTVQISLRFLPARNGVRVSFGGLNNATSVRYMLTYDTNGKSEGLSGSVNPSENSTSRDLQFATCSSGTCVKHANITNMKLEITSQLTSGKTAIKRYRIRV